MTSKENAKIIAEFEDKSLLVVDDDNPFRDRLSRAMEKKGFTVLQAESVKKGIDFAISSKPEFGVVDLRLNDGNGIEVVREIQKTNPKLIPALAILSLRCSVYSVIPLSFSVISIEINPVMSKSYSSNSELR